MPNEMPGQSAILYLSNSGNRSFKRSTVERHFGVVGLQRTMTRPLVKVTSSRTCVAKSQPARCRAGVMYWVQMSRSERLFLSVTREGRSTMLVGFSQHITLALANGEATASAPPRGLFL